MENQESVEVFTHQIERRFVKSFLDMLILRSVEAEPTWGYGIIKKTESTYKVKLRHGALYPMLNTLEAKGFVKSRKELQKGRMRKIYEITLRGKQVLHAYYDSLRQQLPQKNNTGGKKSK